MSENPGPDGDKLGERIAQRIQAAILAGDYGVGDRIGAEDDLARRFGVSRWIAREAIAIMEMDGLVESRRGGAGGLYVCAPAASLRVAVLRHYLLLTGASIEQVSRARALIEKQVIGRVLRRLTIADATMLRGYRGRPEGDAPEQIDLNNKAIQRALLRISGQPALGLFVLALSQANIDRALWNGAPRSIIQQLSDQVFDLRLQQVEALIGQDESAALAFQDAINEATTAMIAGFADPPTDVPTAIERASILAQTYAIKETLKSAKKPEAVARLLAQQIVSRGLSPGDNLGAEDELLAKLKVSRNVLREAKRLLERYGIVRTQRGHDGGLRVIHPDPIAVVRATGLYLAPAYAEAPQAFHRISAQLLLLAADLAAARGEREVAEREALAAFRRTTAALDTLDVREQTLSFYDYLANASNDPVIECLMRCLIFPIGFPPVPAPAVFVAGNRQVQTVLANAIAAGDAPLARRAGSTLWRAGAAMMPIARDVIAMLSPD